MSKVSELDKEKVIQELRFKAVRSGGAGGQHVNKVATKVILTFDLKASAGITDQEKELLLRRLEKKLTKDYKLLLHCEATRSQSRNRVLVTQRFLELLEQSLKRQKKRKRTAPTKASVEKRLADKRRTSKMKESRKPPEV